MSTSQSPTDKTTAQPQGDDPRSDSQRGTPSKSPHASRTRRAWYIGSGAVILIGAVGMFGYWYLHGRYYESTDDAYVEGDVVQITSEVAGTVMSLKVDDTQQVRAGQSLIELDPADATIAEASVEADLARAVRQVRGLFAQTRELHAEVAQREQALRTAAQDLNRRQDLLAEGAISAEELSHAKDAVTSMDANLAAARQQLDETVAQIDGTTIADHPQVLAAAAAVRNSALALHRTVISSPVNGIAAKRSVQVGQRVAPGSPLLAVVPLADLWVTANFKEVQLARMRIGQPVSVRTDVYKRDVIYHGHLVGIAAGSGSAFALLPAQNASGNWIKIVQRVPVRILLDERELEAHPLRVGLSTTVSVDIHDTSGPPITLAARNVPLPTGTSAGADPSVDERIAAIIAENGGPSAHEQAKLSRNGPRGPSPPL